ncbi:AI-2E family transporter [Miltoncostaea oceani]|uniref:AI-2E family transporter n=1 Tax=Miltoncostaea oceani TaxID=2843216 RepID=UPI001C3D6E52|nr:AI-2E family transporter [Miltoncostaea oceani]
MTGPQEGTPPAADGAPDPLLPPRTFAPPAWLRDMGRTAWALVGIAVVVVGALLLLGVASDIVTPVIAAGVAASVAGPAVAWMGRRWRLPRAAGAGIVLLGLLGAAVVIALMVVHGITGQADEIRAALSSGADTIEGWADDAGTSQTGDARQDLEAALPAIGGALLGGVVQGISGLTSLAFFLSFFFFSTFFLLKDGPVYRRFADRHLGLPRPVATIITGDVVGSLRDYFYGVTLVAVFNAVLVGAGALALGVPLAGTIAVVTFVTAYIPFIGAFISGAFAVVIALGSEGTDTALLMLVIVLLANGILQQIVQPIAFGATLDLNPLVVLITTIAGGALFGMPGLVLGAPLTAAGVRIAADVARARSGVGAAPVATTAEGP